METYFLERRIGPLTYSNMVRRHKAAVAAQAEARALE